MHLSLPAIEAGIYADAQIDDYGSKARRNFPWRPPLRMEVRARTSLPAASMLSTTDTPFLSGTAGFGFWNYPFSVRGDVLMMPEAVWFFYASPPSNMAFVPGIPGWGWKAQVVHAMRWQSLSALIPTALSIGWGRISRDTRSAARWLQRATGTYEAILAVEMTQWHTYRLGWLPTAAHFWVDENRVLSVPHPPVARWVL